MLGKDLSRQPTTDGVEGDSELPCFEGPGDAKAEALCAAGFSARAVGFPSPSP